MKIQQNSIWDLLPIDPPADFDPSIEDPNYFYINVIKPLIPDFIRIMNNSLTIDWNEVENLRIIIDNVLENVTTTLANNSIIQKFQEVQYPIKFKEYQTEVFKSKRAIEYYLKEYDDTNTVHRTYLTNTILKHEGYEKLIQDKYTIKEIKGIIEYSGLTILQNVIDKKYKNTDLIVFEAMLQLAKDKTEIWNKVRDIKVETIEKDKLVPPFNPGSSKQKKELFEMLGIDALATSKDTGEASWGRDQIEEYLYTIEEEDTVSKEYLQAFIDYSYSAIIRNNFLESFDKFTIGDMLFSNLKLFGAKTFRVTGNSPNLLQMPSTGSIYAKPLKKCFIAPKGYLVAAIDYSALEDRVIANLSGDINKLSIFTEGLDGHSLNACGYFPEKIAEILGPNTDNTAYVKKFMKEVENGNKKLKQIRQDSKPPTFALAYGAYPPKIATAIKCSLETATEIFDNYHDKLYPNITKYREQYVLPTTKKNGYIHLGFGCRLYSNNANKDIRTLNNATIQFWSILTLITINKLHKMIDEEGFTEDIKVITSIYDSIYFIVKKEINIIKWLNDTLIPIMEKDFVKNQIVHNSANLEIGKNWADLHELKHNEDIEGIQTILDICI